MRKIFLVQTAAFLAFTLPVFSADEIIVMDRAYYEMCRNGFFLNVGLLNNSVDSAYNFFNNQFSLIGTNIENARDQIYLANQNANYLLQSSNLTSTDRDKAQLIYEQTLNAYNSQNQALGQIQTTTNQLELSYNQIIEQISVVSNSFPVEITSTNFILEVTVLVTNNFEFATNAMDQAEHSYTNFLNYYRGIEDYMLDQFRATVTNLLDTTSLLDMVNRSYWPGAQSGGISPGYYWNIDWGYISQYQAGTVANGAQMDAFIFNTNPRYNPWTSSTYRLYTNPTSSDITLRDFLVFTTLGVHDNLNEIAVDMRKQLLLLLDTCTNNQFSATFTVAQTNQMINFLSSPETYSEQVSKIARSKNWYQRIEHWLSAIARNTYKEDKTEISDDVESEYETQYETVSNDVFHAVSGAFSPIQEIAPNSTNVFAVAKEKFTENITGIFNVFSEGKPSSRGGIRASGNEQTAAQRFKKVNFMEVSFVNESLREYTGKEPALPNYITVQDVENVKGANSAWSISLRIADIVHKVMGVIWCLVGFGLVIYEMIMLLKFFVVIWYRLLKYIPNISRYAFGT